jgi:Rad3-related DNA helicase
MKAKGHPFSEWRPDQLKAVDSCVKAIKGGTKFLILEGPTGAGKSSVAVEILRRIGGGRILTSQVLLQEQYQRDYPEFFLLKGSRRYTCTYPGPPTVVNGKAVGPHGWDKVGVTDHCGESMKWIRREGAGRCGKCPYVQSVTDAANASYSIMNYHSYYFQNRNREGLFKGTNLVLDEAHNLNKITTDLYTREFKEFAGFTYPDLAPGDCHNGKNKGDSVDITNTDYVDQVLNNYLSHIDARTKVCAMRRGVTYRREEVWLRDLRSQVSFQINYVKQPYFTYSMVYKDHKSYLVCKPIDVRRLIDNSFYSENRVKVFMSATILNVGVFCKEMGLNPKDVFHYRMEDVFDPRRHLIRFVKEPRNMKAKGREDALLKLAKTLKTILDRHSGQKGIIHAQTYKACDSLRSILPSSRITFSRDIKQALKEHREKDSSVLISPAMKEGVNLAGKDSEFQVMLIVPFPIFDLHTLNKMKINGKFYQWATAIDFVQSLGRSIRTESDTCVTYLIDSRFYSHIHLMRDSFSDYLQECLPFDMEKVQV